MSLLPEGQLPAVLPELPPPGRQPARAVEAAPVAASPRLSQPRASSVPDPTLQPDQSLPKSRNAFTREEDRLLTQHIKKCGEAGLHLNGNKIYRELAAMVSSVVRPGLAQTDCHQYPSHTMHSWRDRWVRHLSQRPREEDEEDEETEQELAQRRLRHALAANPLPGNRSRPEGPQGPPATAPQRPPRDASQPTPRATAAVPPPPTATAPSPRRGTAGQPSNRLQDLARKRARIQAARTIQRVWRGYLSRKDLENASEAITAFQAGAQGFLTRAALGLGPEEIEREPQDTAWFTAVEPAAPREDPLLPEDELDEAEDGLEEEVAELEEEEAELEEEDAELEEEDAELEEAEGGFDEGEDKLSHAAAAVPAAGLATSQQIPAATPKDALNISKEDFWEYFGEFCDVNGVAPITWVQIGPSTVRFWDLWRCATLEPRHAYRDWEVVAEDLGFDWIAEPHVPLLLKAAFEKHLLGFQEQLVEFGLLGGAEGEIGEEGDDGEEREDIEEEDEEGGQETDEEAASEPSDANFVSSPPVAGLKRLRSSSAVTPRAVSKRARHDPSSEIPCTPDSRTEQPAQPLTAQLDGAEDDDLTPSRQLQFEIEEYSPVKRTPRNPQRAFLSSANQPLPSVEHDDDETSDSSDAFESPSKLPIRSLPRRRALPWSTASQPAIPQPAPRQAPQPTPANPPSSSLASTSASISTSAPLDPTPIFNHFLAMHYLPAQIARAVHTTTTHRLPSNSLVHVVLEALERGEDVPANRGGVWTDRDNKKLREVGKLVDRLERGESIPSSVGGDERKEVLRGLVRKHGREAVAGRWRYLKAWERA